MDPATASPSPQRLRSRRSVWAAVVWVLAAGVLACGDGTPPEPEGGVDRQTFVETYVDLRVAALRELRQLPEGQRREILERHGVTEEGLLEFAEHHGGDAAYMRDVWSEVEARLEEIRGTAYKGPSDSVG